MLFFNDKDKIYDRIANKSIEISNSSIIDSIETRSLIKCIEECEENPFCHYVEFSNNVCNLYDKRAFYSLKVESGNNTKRLYERSRFSKRELNGYKKLDANINRSIKCWEECLKEFDCVDIYYDRSKLQCYHFNYNN